MTGNIGFLLLALLVTSASAMVLPPRPTPVFARPGQPCSGLYVENRTAAILMYCEKQTIPDRRGDYMNAFSALSQLFEGNLPRFHPNPYPGLPSFIGSEHPDELAPLLSTEFQLFSNIGAFMDHLTGPGTANVSGDVLTNDTAFVCAYFGPATDVELATFEFVQSIINGIHGTNSYFLPQWPMNNIGPDNLPDHVHGFVINDVVDFNSQNPPLNNLPICPGPTLSLPPEQRTGHVIIMANFTTVRWGAEPHAEAADALTNVYRTGYRCVITFVTVEQPQRVWPSAGNAVFWAAMMFSSWECLRESFLFPSVPATSAAVSDFMDSVKSIDLIVTGLDHAQLALLRRSLVDYRQGLQIHGRINALPTRDDATFGYMANRVINVNCNSFQACNAITNSSAPSPAPSPAPGSSPAPSPAPTRSPTPPPPADTSTYRGIIQDLDNNIYISHNYTAVRARLDSTFIATSNFQVPSLGFTGRYTRDGMQGLITNMRTYFSVSELPLTDLLEQGSTAVSYLHWVGRAVRTGRALNTTVVQKWTFDPTTRLALRLEEFTEASLKASILTPPN